ncbi:MAG: Ig-like domain-containing protein [Candidatus Poribacteria bacterium]|nr:Ig-like domain-containing protein [Candidatus Poribacteria bacterium]MDP6747336.1 Ig-like domain-containing protein [Candidatus Poribacteria bacterium]
MAQQTELAASPQAGTTLTISLKDDRDRLVSGERLTLSVDQGTVSAPTDNGDGTFTATYTALHLPPTDALGLQPDGQNYGRQRRRQIRHFVPDSAGTGTVGR